MNKKIAVLFGGKSSERNISIQSGHAIINSLLKFGLEVYPFDIGNKSIIELSKKRFDKAYIALHGKGGEDGSIQGALEYLKIPYTGSRIMASSISIDKFRSKLLWKSSGILTIPDVYISKKEFITSANSIIIQKILSLGLPVLVKPNTQGSSIGITIVYQIKKLNDAIHQAFLYDDKILIEKFIKGEEYTISILDKVILPSVHISTKNNFYDYEAKYLSNFTKYSCPSGLTKEQEKKLKKNSNFSMENTWM